MVEQLDSRGPVKTAQSVAYVSSSPDQGNWGQPALSNYVVLLRNNRMATVLLKGVYQTASPSGQIGSRESLKQEMLAWDRASDEAWRLIEDLASK